ncbi:MarR family winged helix-turn-helix transcriptional regulator [Streptomyces sp. NPDC056242]|uniref:MarR family winged helix-turn-helix transcriptional regulator n=1 Tax=unclassified Streptomyces TaxID=2593676 RepID=UPI0035D80998
MRQLATTLERPHDGSRSSSTRADSTVHSRSGLTYQAGQLEKAGLIQRAPSPDDERSVIAVITDAGRDTFARGLPGHLDVVDKGMLSVLDDHQLDALATSLTAIRDRLRSQASSAAQRRKNRG